MVAFSACKKDKNEDNPNNPVDTPADAGIKKAKEICDCFKKSSVAEGDICVRFVNEKAEYLKYEENASFEEAFHNELEKCDADTPAWY